MNRMGRGTKTNLSRGTTCMCWHSACDRWASGTWRTSGHLPSGSYKRGVGTSSKSRKSLVEPQRVEGNRTRAGLGAWMGAESGGSFSWTSDVDKGSGSDMSTTLTVHSPEWS